MVYFQSVIPKSGANLLWERSLWEIDPFFYITHPNTFLLSRSSIFSNRFPNSTQLKLTSQQAPRLDSTGAVKHTRHEFDGKIKSKPLKTLGTVHVVYVHLSNTAILIFTVFKTENASVLSGVAQLL